MAVLRPLLMPKLGLTMTEGVVTQWRLAPGARFRRGEVVLIIETDKVAHDLEAPTDGVLRAILVAEGDVAPVAAELGTWTLDEAETQASAPAATAIGASQAAPSAAATLIAGASPRFIRATPLARRLAREKGIALGSLAASGPCGRIVADDVGGRTATPPAAPPDNRSLTRRAASPYERTMAERLTIAKRDTPHFYLMADLDVGILIDWHRALNPDPARPRVTITHLLVAAMARALAATPHMNRVWRDGDVLSFHSIDIGVAVETQRGLANPLARDLQGDVLDEVVRKVDDVVARARAGLLRAPDLDGGALSLSNAGRHDLRYMSSIIPPGQSAILGIGTVQSCFRPGARGEPVLRRELGVVLSSDHRIHSGVRALEFLDALRSVLATPDTLLARAREEV